MSDLIDRKMAVQGIKELFSLGNCYCDELSIVGMLNALPSAEPERTVKVDGTTYVMGLSFYCGNCGKPVHFEGKYCHHCGAKLDWGE